MLYHYVSRINLLTQNRLKELLHYDPETGLFTWILSRRGAKAGNTAGCVMSDGYISIKVDDKPYKAHRLAFLYMTGKFPSNDVDHIDVIRANNKWENLRTLNRSENQQNRKKPRADNKTGFLGVIFNKRRDRYIARIAIDGKNVHLGTFLAPEKASEAYQAAKKSLHIDDTFKRAA